MFCTKTQETKACSLIMLTRQISGHFACLTTLTNYNFLTLQFRNLTPSPIILSSNALRKIHKYVMISFGDFKQRKSFYSSDFLENAQENSKKKPLFGEFYHTPIHISVNIFLCIWNRFPTDITCTQCVHDNSVMEKKN